MDEGSKWQLVGLVAVVMLAVFAAVRILDRGPEAAGGEPVRVSRGGRTAGGGGAAGRRPALVVHVAGAVRRPGVYRVPDGARVAAAIARAGGAAGAADLTAVNLAAPVADGQQVVVPVRLPGARAGGAGGAASGGAGQGPISLGTATAEELAELDGIGETIAERIVEYRIEHGGLRSIDELGEVDGIGEKRLEALKDELQP